MPNLLFRVHAAAIAADGIPDPIPVYAGSTLPAGSAPTVFSGALVVAGLRAGRKWQGCQYWRPPFIQPGVGEIEEL